MVFFKVKRFKLELLTVLVIILLSVIISCKDIYISIKSLIDVYSLCLQIITGILGLYFTAFTIFIGLGLSPKKMDLNDLIVKLKNANLSDDDIENYIKGIKRSYGDSLGQASENFKDTILILTIIFSIFSITYGYLVISNDEIFSCSNNCAYFINSILLSYAISSTVYSGYLIYDSAKFLTTVRRLL